MEKMMGSLCISITGAIVFGSLSNGFSSQDNIWKHLTKNTENEVYLANEKCINILDMYTRISSENGVLSMNKEYLNNIQKLSEIGNLPENWNGYTATTFSKEFIGYLKQNILMLDKQPEIFPIAYGNVQFEYDHEDGGYLEFEISPDSVIKCYIEEPDGEYKEYPIADFNMINQEVKNFYGI